MGAERSSEPAGKPMQPAVAPAGVATATGTGLVRLTEAPTRLRREFGVAGSYFQCWRLCVDGAVPFERRGRALYVAEADLPALAQTIRTLPRRRVHGAPAS